MTLDVVPAEVEVVAVIRIYTKPQQFLFNTWTGEPSLGVLIISISQIPEKIVTVHVNKADELVAHPFMSTYLPKFHPADVASAVALWTCAWLAIVHVAWRIGCAVLVLHLPPHWLILSGAIPALACAAVFACRIRLCHVSFFRNSTEILTQRNGASQ